MRSLLSNGYETANDFRMSKRPIIIHVPKTGGTTLFMAISGSPKPPAPNLLYRHIKMNSDNTEMKSNCGDLFDAIQNDRYVDQKVILIMRNPLERIESEFGFLGNREMFRCLWKHNISCEYPKTLREYVKHPSNANSICRFLLGMPMYTGNEVTQEQFDNIISTLDKLPFVFGKTDQMGLTVANVSHRCAIRFGDTLPRFRTSLYKPKRDDSWQDLEAMFNLKNEFDIGLVNEITTRFEAQTANISDSKIVSFDGDEYKSVYPFICADKMRSPLEIFANDLDEPTVLYNWIELNNASLEPTLKQCLERNNGNGRTFLVEWLEETIPELLGQQPLDINKEDPLQTLRLLVEKKFIET